MKKIISYILMAMFLRAQEVLETSEITTQAPKTFTQAQNSQSFQSKDGGILEQNQINTTNMLAYLFPSLKIYPQGSDTFAMITLRGVSGPDFYSYVLGLYVDGVPQSPNFMIQALGDVESVRLVNGAQGLFYGENAPLGLIDIQTKSPLKGNYAKISASASILQEEIMGYIGWNLIEDRLWIKTNMRYLHDNGFLKDPLSKKMLNDGDALTLGLTLYYLPMEQMLISLHYDYHYSLTHKDFFLSKSQANTLKFQTSEQISGYEQYQQGEQNKIFNAHPFNTLQAHNLSAKMDYYFDSSTLSLMSAFQKTHTLGNSYPGIFVKDSKKDGNYYNTLQFIEELKLHHHYNHGIEGIFGAYYKFFVLDNGMHNVPTGSANPPSPPLYYNGDWRALERVHTFALYGDGHIPYKNWSLDAGLRYQFYYAGIDVPLPPMFPQMPPYKDGEIFHALNPRLSLTYHLNQEHQFFIQFSNSTKPGGFSKFPFADTDMLAYKQEQIYTFELGSHSKFLHSSLRVDTSLYGLFRNNTQAYVGEGYNKSIANIGKAYAIGLDAEMAYELERFFGFVNMNLSYSRFGKDARNAGFLTINQTASHYDVRGLAPRFSPLLSLSIGADFILLKTNAYQLILSNLLHASSSYFLDDFNHGEDFIQKPFMLLNSSLICRWKHYEVMLFAQNLTNSSYFTSMLWDGKGRAYTVGNPINIGMKFTYTY